MNLNAITEADDIRQSLETVWQNISSGGQQLNHRVASRRPRAISLPICWHPELKLWAGILWEGVEGRYWFPFGIDDPNATERPLSIPCEINPPMEGIDRSCAGLFVRDFNGHVFLTHSGKIGGGQTGVGKFAFLDFYRKRGGKLETIQWPDGKETQAIILGQIDKDDLPSHLADFVHKVADFKRRVKAGAGPDST